METKIWFKVQQRAEFLRKITIKRIILCIIYLSMMMFPVFASGTLPLKGDVDKSGNITLQNVTPMATTTIDVHSHAGVFDSSASAQQLLDLMTANSISKVIMMQPPMPGYQDTEYSNSENSENLRNFFLSRGSSFLYMYGGAELQPFLYATGHTGQITLAELYPNGGAELSQADIDKLNAIAADTTNTYKKIFQDRATAAAQSGKYVGFGELAPLHYSQRSGHPYMIYKVDTPWMLWLSDLAAQYNMVLDIHFEATATTLAEFATLLAYNTKTKIIWDHAGWSSSGEATAAVFSQMLADHPNLYLSLKMRGNSKLAAGSPTDSNGNLKSEWNTLLTTYADRIMVGNDSKYWLTPGVTIESELADTYTLLDNMLKLLPTDTAQKIRNGTAKTLFDPVACSFSLSPASYAFSTSSGTGNITVTPSLSSCTWTAAVSADASPWISITSGNSGTGSGTVNYSVSQNTGTSARKGTITIAGQTFIVAQEGTSEKVFLISLANGWNLISFPLQPADMSVAKMLNDISNNCIIVWEFTPLSTWKSYDPNDPTYSELKNFTNDKGYWIKMKEDKTLAISGTDPSKTINLVSGWNLIGYTGTSETPVGTVLQSVANQYTIVWEFTPPSTWKSYDPNDPAYSELKNFISGKGYWIKTKDDLVPPSIPF